MSDPSPSSRVPRKGTYGPRRRVGARAVGRDGRGQRLRWLESRHDRFGFDPGGRDGDAAVSTIL